MRQKDYITTTWVIFAFIASVHLVRALLGWEVVISGIVIPVWVSYVVATLCGYLAFIGYKMIRK